MPGGAAIIIGNGAELIAVSTIGNLPKIAGLTPPTLNDSLLRQATDGAVGFINVGATAPTAAGATETFRTVGGIISQGAGTDTLIIGRGANAGGAGNQRGIAIGTLAQTGLGNEAVVIGYNAVAGGQSGVLSIGPNASVTGAVGMALGDSSVVAGGAGGAVGIAIGRNAAAKPNAAGYSLALGDAATAWEGDTVIGHAASSNQHNAFANYNVVIGQQAHVNVTVNAKSTVIGAQAYADVLQAVAIGRGAFTVTPYSVVIGESSGNTAPGTYAIIVGQNSGSNHAANILLGHGAASFIANAFVVGGTNTDITTVMIGSTNLAATPPARTFRWTNAKGADNAAGDVTWIAPRSTGAATGAKHIFQVGQPGASSSTLQTAVTALTLDSSSTLIRANFGTSIIQMGAAPPTGGAVLIDTASYSGYAFRAKNGTVSSYLWSSGSVWELGSDSATEFYLTAGNTKRWNVSQADGAAVSTLGAAQATARIVGGSSNGLAIRNSANTRDNFLFADAGDTFTGNDGTRSYQIYTSAASGEAGIGVKIRGLAATSGTWLQAGGAGTAGVPAGITYSNQTQNYSALEVANVASGFGTLALMKSGGAVVIGTDPGTTATLRVGGGIRNTDGNSIGNATRGGFYMTADGVMVVSNNAGSGFTSMQFGQSAGVATSNRIQKQITAMADNTFRDVFTVTVPNAANAATIRLLVSGTKGAGDAEGANGSTSSVEYIISVQRTAGVTTTAATSATIGAVTTTIAAGNAVTATAQCSAMTGAVGAQQTFTIQVKVARAAGASTNHSAFCVAELLNANATGISIA